MAFRQKVGSMINYLDIVFLPTSSMSSRCRTWFRSSQYFINKVLLDSLNSQVICWLSFLKSTIQTTRKHIIKFYNEFFEVWIGDVTRSTKFDELILLFIKISKITFLFAERFQSIILVSINQWGIMTSTNKPSHQWGFLVSTSSYPTVASTRKKFFNRISNANNKKTQNEHQQSSFWYHTSR